MKNQIFLNEMMSLCWTHNEQTYNGLTLSLPNKLSCLIQDKPSIFLAYQHCALHFLKMSFYNIHQSRTVSEKYVLGCAWGTRSRCLLFSLCFLFFFFHYYRSTLAFSYLLRNFSWAKKFAITRQLKSSVATHRGIILKQQLLVFLADLANNY